MVLRLEDKELVVEDARKHPEESVENLRGLLAAGAPAEPDPHRRNFYEVQNGCNIYYVHISPATGKVLLLGIWPKNGRTGRSHDRAAD